MSKFVINQDTLQFALNFNFKFAGKFELYRRKDDRIFKFIRYDGSNYDEICEYLQTENNNVNIPSSKSMLPGQLFNVNGNNECVRVSERFMDCIISSNSYIIENNKYYNLLFNYNVARHLLLKYDNIKLKISSEVNSGKSFTYSSIEELDKLPFDSYFRTHRVWLIHSKNMKIQLDELPPDVMESYMRSEDYYQEYETYIESGKVGVMAWRSEIIVEPFYQSVLIENYRAYLQNEKGYWAEYSLKTKKMKSDFIYLNIAIDGRRGTVTAEESGRKVTLHSPKSCKDLIIAKGDGGYFGVQKGNKWIIPAIYEFVSLWKNSDIFEVYRDGKYGLIDNSGKCILSCSYGLIDAPTPETSLYKASVDDKWGVVGFGDYVYSDFKLEKNSNELEGAYWDSINNFININYRRHKFLPLRILKINRRDGYILMNIVNCNRTFKIYKDYLPEEVFIDCMSNYWQAIKILRKLAIRVNKNDRIIIDYAKTLEWINYRSEVYKLHPFDRVIGVIYSLDGTNYVIKLETGVFGVMARSLDRSYIIGEQLNLIVKKVVNQTVVFTEA